MNIEKQFLGTFTRLHVIRKTKYGVVLSSGKLPQLEVLLPNNQVRPETETGDFYEVLDRKSVV